MTKTHSFSINRRQLMAAAAASIFAPTTLFAAQQDYGIEGQLAPELQVPIWIDGDGKPTHFKLSDHRGKFVFLELWQAWCPGCHSHGFPTLQKIVAKFKNSPHFVPVGIQTTFEGFSVNTENKLTQMQKRYKLPIVMGHDAGDASTHRRPNTMQSYRTGGTPWAILISPNGRVIYNGFSIDGDSAIRYLTKEIKNLS